MKYLFLFLISFDCLADVANCLKLASPGSISLKRDKCLGELVIDSMVEAKRSLTTAQRKQLGKDMADIEDALRRGNLDVAEEDINAINPDGVIITSQNKTDVLLIINSRKAP